MRLDFSALAKPCVLPTGTCQPTRLPAARDASRSHPYSGNDTTPSGFHLEQRGASAPLRAWGFSHALHLSHLKKAHGTADQRPFVLVMVVDSKPMICIDPVSTTLETAILAQRERWGTRLQDIREGLHDAP